jgi:prenyltransferase beta subunit
MRRLLLPLLAFLLFSAPSLRAADVKMDEATKKATAKALDWLKTKQNADGSFSDGRYPHNTAITSFALLAFMSQGHLPGQGTFGPEVAKGCRFLLSSSRASDGYLVGARGGNMYCHAMATLALAELFGMTNDEEIKPVLEKATNLIVKSQNNEGGWRYEPQPSGADISVTIMQVMALRAAKNSGMHVPEQTMKKAIEYINRCYNPNTGAFSYQPNSRPGFARTAAGVCVLQLTGNYDAKQITKAVEYLKVNFDSKEHFWYGHYYATHGMHQVGGKDWEEWYGKLKDMLLPLQTADGNWNTKDREGVGMVYQTSIAVISLSVPLNYLPIFQR